MLLMKQSIFNKPKCLNLTGNQAQAGESGSTPVSTCHSGIRAIRLKAAPSTGYPVRQGTNEKSRTPPRASCFSFLVMVNYHRSI